MKGEGKGIGQGGGKPRKTRPRGLRGGLGFCVSYSFWVGLGIYIQGSGLVYVNREGVTDAACLLPPPRVPPRGRGQFG